MGQDADTANAAEVATQAVSAGAALRGRLIATSWRSVVLLYLHRPPWYMCAYIRSMHYTRSVT